MALAEGCDTESLTELVQSKVQGAEAIRHHGKEMAFALPMDQVSQFPGNLSFVFPEAAGLHLVTRPIIYNARHDHVIFLLNILLKGKRTKQRFEIRFLSILSINSAIDSLK